MAMKEDRGPRSVATVWCGLRFDDCCSEMAVVLGPEFDHGVQSLHHGLPATKHSVCRYYINKRVCLGGRESEWESERESEREREGEREGERMRERMRKRLRERMRENERENVLSVTNKQYTVWYFHTKARWDS